MLIRRPLLADLLECFFVAEQMNVKIQCRETKFEDRTTDGMYLMEYARTRGMYDKVVGTERSALACHGGDIILYSLAFTD